MMLFRRMPRTLRMRQKLSRILTVIVLAVSVVGIMAFSGCGKDFMMDVRSVPVSGNGVYYRDGESLSTIKVPYSEEFLGTDTDISDLLTALKDEAAGGRAEPLMPENVIVKSYSHVGNILTLDFSKAYYRMSAADEILARSGYVKTLLQLDTVTNVIFTVEGEPLVNSKGKEVGRMNGNTFIENAGKSVNSIMSRQITLYFADESGTILVPEGRSIYYNSNKPLEWAIVERLIAGPKSEACYRTMAADTIILSVFVQNNVCYVNLSDSSQSAVPVSDEALIYSLVNSLTGNCDIDKVQISINGNTDVMLGGVNINQLFEENKDLIAQVTK